MKIFLSILGLFYCIQLSAQDLYQTVRGRVHDAISSDPLIGATVILLDSNQFIACVTDYEGKFRLEKVPIGRQNFKISYIGFEDKYFQNILVTSGKEVVIKAGMEESLKQLDVVTVKAKHNYKPINNLALVSAQSFSIEQSERYAASINDPARLAQSFAGVAQNSDFGNEISIRGNSPKGLLWQVEGLSMPNPNHYGEEGGSGGVVSILSNNVLDHSDFFTGAFPAEYGNALSGVFDFHLRPGNNEKREYTLEIGMIGMDAAIEGPFSKKNDASYLINYRYSTLGFLEKMGYNLQGRSVTSFQDLNIKLHFPLKSGGSIGLFGIGGSSTTAFDRDLSKRNPDLEHMRAQERYFYDIGMLGLTYEQHLSPKTKLNSAFGIGGYRLTTGSIVTHDLNGLLYEEENASGDYSYRYHLQASHKINGQHYLKFGFRLNNLHYLSYRATRDTSDWERQYEAKGKASYWENYAQWKYRLSDKFSLTPGIHASYFQINQQFVLEPRFALQYKIRPSIQLRAGLGMHSMTESLITYLGDKDLEDLYRPNMDLLMGRAIHNVLGFDKTLGPNWTISLEGYYQYLYDIPIRDKEGSNWSSLNYNRGFIKKMNNNGKGLNYGLEFTVRKSFNDSWYLLANASLFESKYMAMDSTWHDSRYNNNFIYNLTAGKDFKVGKDKKNILGINFKCLWMGGRRMTPIDLKASINEGQTVYVDAGPFSDRLSDYFRADARVSYRKNNPSWSWVLSLDIQNLTNRYNVFRLLYNPLNQELEHMEQIGIVPALKFRVEL